MIMKNSREGNFHRIPGKYPIMIRAIPAWLRRAFSRADRRATCPVSGSTRSSDACERLFWPEQPDSRHKVAFDVCENSPESAVSTGCVVPRRERSFAKPPSQVWLRRRQVLQAQERTGRKPCAGRWKTRPGNLSPGAGATFGKTGRGRRPLSPRRRLCGYSSRKALTAFRASPGQHLAPAARRHARSEAMIPGALDPAGLKSSFHDSFRFAVTGFGRLNPGARILVVLRGCCKTNSPSSAYCSTCHSARSEVAESCRL